MQGEIFFLCNDNKIIFARKPVKIQKKSGRGEPGKVKEVWNEERNYGDYPGSMLAIGTQAV